MDKQMYYCNQACTVKAELDNDEVLITLIVGEFYENDGFDESGVFPVERTLVVNKKYISSDIIDFQSKASGILREAEKESKDIISQARSDSREILTKSKDELKAISNRLKSFEGFEPFLDYLDGKIEYVLYAHKYCNNEEYDYKILPIKEFDSEEREGKESYDRDLKAYLFNRKSDKRVQLCMSQYSDYSGSDKYTVDMFLSFNDLQKHVYSILNTCKTIGSRGLSDLVKWGFTHEKIKSKIDDNNIKKETEKQKKIEKLKTELIFLETQEES